MEKKKNLTIETLRGAVILLVVIGHVIGSGAEGGMRVADDSFMRYVYYTFIEFIQMPLFAGIAGWVYALRPARLEFLSEFIRKKFMRILIPMFVVGLTYFLVQYITPGTNMKGELSKIWRLLLFPYNLYWFLYSLFLVFMVVAAFDAYKLIDTITRWWVFFLISFALVYFRDVLIPLQSPNYLSYKGALYLLPAFLIGIGINRFKPFFSKKALIYTALALVTACIAVQQLAWFGVINYMLLKDTGVGLFIGLLGTLLLFRLKIQSQWLVWFGSFAYSIYLFHAFGTGGGRILAIKAGVESVSLVFIASLAAGVGLPILADKILGRFKITRILFLGKD